MVTGGGGLSARWRGSSLVRDGPRALGKPPRALSRGHKFQVGQEGVNGAASRPTPPPARVSPAPNCPGRVGLRPALPRAPNPRGCPRTHARTPARTHAASLFPLSPRARRHDRVGLHAGSDPRRASRHARRTRPRSAGSGAQSSRARGFLTPPEHVTASASAKYAVLCDFDTPPQGHKLSIYSVTRIQTCHTLAQTFTNPASPAATAGRVTLSHAVCGRDTGPSSYTGDIYTPIKPHQQHKDANR